MRRTATGYRSAARGVALELAGMLRRLTVGASGTRLWQLLGFSGAYGESETFDKVEVFQGIGFAARPRAGKGEVIVGNMGGKAGHPVGISSRDAEIIPDLEEDESALFNSQSIVKIDEGGIVRLVTAAANESLVRGDIYRTAEGNANAAVAAAMTAIATAMTSLGQAAAATAATTAASSITVFENGATAYLSPNAKVQ